MNRTESIKSDKTNWNWQVLCSRAPVCERIAAPPINSIGYLKPVGLIYIVYTYCHRCCVCARAHSQPPRLYLHKIRCNNAVLGCGMPFFSRRCVVCAAYLEARQCNVHSAPLYGYFTHHRILPIRVDDTSMLL